MAAERGQAQPSNAARSDRPDEPASRLFPAVNLFPLAHVAVAGGIGTLANGGVSLDGAAVVRCLTGTAYRAGVSYVEAIRGDDALQLASFSHAPRDSFEATSEAAASGADLAALNAPSD